MLHMGCTRWRPLLLVLLLLIAAHQAALATSDLGSVLDPQLRVRFVEEFAPEAETLPKVDMIDPRDGQKYTCALPDLTKVVAAVDQEPELDGPPHNVIEFLEGLGAACMYRVEGWWVYEFCYGSRIRQYHQEKEQVVAEFYLGRGPSSSGTSTKEYYAELYGDGTTCDITGAARTTEVRYICAAEPVNLLASVKEAATCSYVITVTTPYLCKHPYYRPKTESFTAIDCIRPEGIQSQFLGVLGQAPFFVQYNMPTPPVAPVPSLNLFQVPAAVITAATEALEALEQQQQQQQEALEQQEQQQQP